MKIRIAKLFSEKNICSRRQAEKWIENGWVNVNGQGLTEPGQAVSPQSFILLNPKALSEKEEQITIILNKPPGYVSTFDDPKYEQALSLITASNFFVDKNQNAKDIKSQIQSLNFQGLGPVGRLDAMSRGLMIYTQDGTLAKKIIGETSEIDKEYIVKVSGVLTDEKVKKLCFGLSLDGKKLKPAKVSIVNKNNKTLRFILQEGRNRQIRRMCQLLDLKVLDLKRIRIGPFDLQNLPEGKWCFLKTTL